MLARIARLNRRRMLGTAALIGVVSLLAGCAAAPASSPRAPAPATRAPVPTEAPEPGDGAEAGPELLLASLMHGDAIAVIDPSQPDTVDHDSFSVTVVDAATLAPTTHEIAPFGTIGGLASWEKPHYGAVDSDGTILLPVQGLVVERLDPITGASSTITSSANSHSHGAALAPASAEQGTNARLLTVGTGAFGNASGDSNLSILDLVSGEERIVPLRVPHETVAYWQNADGAEFAVVAGGNTRELGWDGVTVVALDGLATRELPVAGYPQAIAGFRQS